jgi:hypothetical protein
MSPVLPDVFYQGGRANGSTIVNNGFYKNTISDTTINRSLFLTLPSSITRISMSKAISGDGSTVIAGGTGGLWFPLTVYPEANKAIQSANGYSSLLNFDYYWGNAPSPSWNWYHDKYMSGAINGIDGIWDYLMPENTNGSWWRARDLGSGTGGAPVHVISETPPYAWGGEVEPVETLTSGGTARDPWCPQGTVQGTDCADYLSHFTPDRWAHYGISSKSINSPYGASIYDLRDHTYKVKAFSTVRWTQHHDWSAWSDWSASSANYTLPVNYKDQLITTQNYKNFAQKILAGAHTRYNGSSNPPYTAFARPTQSPDGTKVLFNSTFLNATDDDIQLFWVVAYYPYPPEIKGVAKNGTIIRLVWDFNQGTNCSPDSGATLRTGPTPNFINPRTYATRGWPHETLDCPPSPREIKQFRVWVSTNGAIWSTVGTTAYNNCNGTNECGMWAETAWSYDVSQPANSTRYYAVTSIEHSGLESRNLSNVWKVCLDADGNITQQLQQSGYPTNPGGSNPGGQSLFYKTPPPAVLAEVNYMQTPATASGQYVIKWKAPYNAGMIRYYNIYAKNKSAPFTNVDPPEYRQKSRIASVPASSDYGRSGTFSYIDWLGATDGSTQYIVTAVDYQGNETKNIVGPARVKGIQSTLNPGKTSP